MNKILDKEILKGAVNQLSSKMTELTSKYGAEMIVGAGFTIGAASTIDYMMKKSNKKKVKKENIRQERKIRDKNKLSIDQRMQSIGHEEQYGYQEGLVQEMFSNRKGHSNSWGGRRY